MAGHYGDENPIYYLEGVCENPDAFWANYYERNKDTFENLEDDYLYYAYMYERTGRPLPAISTGTVFAQPDCGVLDVFPAQCEGSHRILFQREGFSVYWQSLPRNLYEEFGL